MISTNKTVTLSTGWTNTHIYAKRNGNFIVLTFYDFRPNDFTESSTPIATECRPSASVACGVITSSAGNVGRVTLTYQGNITIITEDDSKLYYGQLVYPIS